MRAGARAPRGEVVCVEVMFTRTRAHAGDPPLSAAIPPFPPWSVLKGTASENPDED